MLASLVAAAISMVTVASGGPAAAWDPGDPVRDPTTNDIILPQPGSADYCDWPAWWIGTDAPEEPTFDDQRDCADGRGGADVIRTRGGLDYLYGGQDDAPDILNGGRGHDHLFGEGGGDTLDAGAGDDIVAGGLGDDTLLAGSGDDIIRDGDGVDLVTGGPGADTFYLTCDALQDKPTDYDRREGDRVRRVECS